MANKTKQTKLFFFTEADSVTAFMPEPRNMPQAKGVSSYKYLNRY